MKRGPLSKKERAALDRKVALHHLDRAESLAYILSLVVTDESNDLQRDDIEQVAAVIHENVLEAQRIFNGHTVEVGAA